MPSSARLTVKVTVKPHSTYQTKSIVSAKASLIPGKYIEAGLPNIDGSITNGSVTGILSGNAIAKGAFAVGKTPMANILTGSGVENGYSIELNARQSNTIYGNSDTVQPPALTQLPCIKAFDAFIDPGLVRCDRAGK